MKLLIASDLHVYKTPDGLHWTKAQFGYDFWKRYLGVFDKIRLVARTKPVDNMEGKKLLIDGEGIEFFEIPFFQGPKEMLKEFFEIQKALKNVYDGCDAAFFRMPSQTAQMTYWKIPKSMPFAAEIIYDPYEDTIDKNGTVTSRFISKIIANQLQRFCRKANGVSYVTEHSIQEHFPSYAKLFGETEAHFESSYSSISLYEDAYAAPRVYKSTNKRNIVLSLSSVTMNTERKGERVLIDIVNQLRKLDYNVSAVLIGDGVLRKSYEEYAKELGIQHYVNFTGLLPTPDDVREILKNTDIFVFPTQGEGLPRGILEAMAIGLPVLSTPVGGIPEVIDRRYLFDPHDVSGFVNTIQRLIDNPDELNTMSASNFSKSLEYKNSLLQERREVFYKKLKALAIRNGKL